MKKLLLYVAVAINAVACVYPDSSLPKAEKPSSLEILTLPITVSSDAGTAVVKIVSTDDWTVRITYDRTANKEEWCSIDVTSGIGDESIAYDVTISYSANTSYSERSATIHVASNNGNKSINKSLTITQNQLDVINITTDQFNVPAEGDTIAIEEKTNVLSKVEYDSTCGWIEKVENASRGYATRQHRFKIQPNDSAEERQTEVKFTYKDITKIVTIIQAGKSEE